ncbi:hypothetical protein SAMN02746065_11683 [Desulfocicer vacuolatum DSM 3385]|uniref:Uncharacterized protein n=1 Tax=Desulfocicer vacuolatum DSM 3385 TaxID=1121400 RepID=A0A1W2DB66_9BACT|nr:hypothetical protein SAMN02746065_11683 [Desulfocicer vacuolatum DSM 3385]
MGAGFKKNSAHLRGIYFFYMKYSANLWKISIFVVGGAGSKYGPPVAVI